MKCKLIFGRIHSHKYTNNRLKEFNSSHNMQDLHFTVFAVSKVTLNSIGDFPFIEFSKSYVACRYLLRHKYAQFSPKSYSHAWYVIVCACVFHCLKCYFYRFNLNAFKWLEQLYYAVSRAEVSLLSSHSLRIALLNKWSVIAIEYFSHRIAGT